MGSPITKLTIKGFKSIRSLEDFELRPLNILIGANGAGKSHLIQSPQLLSSIAKDELRLLVCQGGRRRAAAPWLTDDA